MTHRMYSIVILVFVLLFQLLFENQQSQRVWKPWKTALAYATAWYVIPHWVNAFYYAFPCNVG